MGDIEMKILIFGAGSFGLSYKTYLENYEEEHVLVGFLDNSSQNRLIKNKQGTYVPVYKPEQISDIEYDLIVISPIEQSVVLEMKSQLLSLGVPEQNILVLFHERELAIKVLAKCSIYDENEDPRVVWLRNYSILVNENLLNGNVAECGVNRGDFAYYINKYFPNKTLYLFDTFEGFDSKDLETERSLNNQAFIQGMFNKEHFFSNVHNIKKEEVALKKMLFPEKCLIKKGYFPNTAEGINDTFVFVNLDMDLYQPMLAGLRFFYERMCVGGVLLLHDYFHPELPGVKQAVQQFEQEYKQPLCKIPIGDFCSIAIIKH